MQGGQEWAEQGQSVFESYEDRGDGDMDVDGQSDNGEGDWWCPEEAACSRHVGYVLFIHPFIWDRLLTICPVGRLPVTKIYARKRRRRKKLY